MNHFEDPYTKQKNKTLPSYVKNNKSKYEIFYDKDGNIRYFEKSRYQNTGYRIKSMEKLYRWWNSRTLDFRYSLIPISGCFVFTMSIYILSVVFYEKEEKIKELSQLPQEVLDAKEQFKEYQKQRELERQQDKLQ